MPVVISGSSGISGVAGTAGSPAISGATPNSGLNFENDAVNISIGSSNRLNVDAYGNVIITGIVTATDITVNNVVAAAATFTGNVSIAGTLTYEDVTNIDSVGLITARTGVRVTSGGISVTAGISTFKGADFDGGALLKEKINIIAGKLSDNTNINVDNGMAHMFTTTETTTSTPNITSSVGINTQMGIGDAMAVTIITTAAAAGYSTSVNIDGIYNDVKWSGGSDPSTGSASGNDVYSLQVIKTGIGTFTVLGALNNFA